jgi:hypothetical protein
VFLIISRHAINMIPSFMLEDAYILPKNNVLFIPELTNRRAQSVILKFAIRKLISIKTKLKVK